MHGKKFNFRGQYIFFYRAEKKSWQILLSRTQTEPGRKVKQEQEEISRNHVPRLFLGSVHFCRNVSKNPEHNIEFHPSSSNSLESDEVEMPLPTAVVVAELVILSCNGAQVKM